jgi:hypothetical protein
VDLEVRGKFGLMLVLTGQPALQELLHTRPLNSVCLHAGHPRSPDRYTVHRGGGSAGFPSRGASMLRLRIACLTAALGFICAAPASAQFTPAGHAQASEFNELLDTVYNSLSSELNRALRVPRPINLSSGECGVPNAFFIPAQPEQADAIVLCTELLRAIAGDIARRNLGETLGLYAFTSQTLFILMHEVGHALVQVLDLPAVGQEEDAADQLATLFMVNEPMLAMWAAEFFGSGLASRQTAGSGFADAHDFGPQRYFNILCWTFGADPDTRAYIVGASRLPPERTATCAAEFSRMRGAWERLLEPHLEDPSAFDELDSVRNASGLWRFTETIESDELSIRCTASGTLALWQYSSDLGEPCARRARVWSRTSPPTTAARDPSLRERSQTARSPS